MDDNAHSPTRPAARAGFIGAPLRRAWNWVFERSPHAVGSELTIGGTLALLYNRKRTIIIFGLIGFMIAAIWISVATRLYAASVPIGPSSSATESGSGGNVSGLLRLATGGSGDNAKFDRYLLQLTSIEVAKRLDQKYGLVKTVYAKQWDAAAGTWKRPSGTVFDIKEGIKGALGLPQWSPPDAVMLAGFLSQRISTAQTASPEIYRVSFRYEDKGAAAPLLAAVLKEANEVIREADLAKSKTSEGYLIRKLTNETSLELRQSLMAILSGEERQLLMINNAKDYTAEPLDAISVSNGPASPPIMLLLVLGPLLGVLIGSLAVFLRP